VLNIDDPIYCIFALVSVRVPLGWTSSGTWTTYKGGASGIEVVVYPSEIRITQAERIARSVVPGYSFSPQATTMRFESIGWLGTSLLSRDRVVLSGLPEGMSNGKPTEAAIAPLQGSTQHLWQVFLSVGVRPESSPSW
jgi:hypothetical protein